MDRRSLCVLISMALVSCGRSPAAVEAARHEFSDQLADGSNGPVMVTLPTGSFQIGSPMDEPGRYDNEGQPQDAMSSQSLAIMKYEVTRSEYSHFVRDSGYVGTDLCLSGYGNNSEWIETPGVNWEKPGFAQTERDPAVCVTWNDAQAYAAWLAQKTGKAYRLPTEVEWEYAVRATTQSTYSFGSDENAICGYANVSDETTKKIHPTWGAASCNDGVAYTSPVGSYKPNGFGLYDMHGNVWEWVQDCYQDNPERIATSDREAVRTEPCYVHVIRGGSWSSLSPNLRSASRQGNFRDTAAFNLGFRLVRASS
jgi:formylglycine-generating enzyme